MNRFPHCLATAAFFASLLLTPVKGADDPAIRWLVEYDGKSLPAAPTWTAQGETAAEVTPAGLRLADASADTFGFFRAAWKPEADAEIVVEATLRVTKATGSVPNKPDSKSVWPWRDGAPVSVLVSDGHHQEGLALSTDRISTWTDRFFTMDTTKAVHTYRLVIRGTDMSVAVDGEVKARGQGAFWKAADGPTPFIQFGSNSKRTQGEAEWQSVRLGVRKASGPAPIAPVKITVSEPWPIQRPELKTKPTRPYVYNIGRGRLIMSVAEGPDALWEPYGAMISDDQGKTWRPVKDWDQTEVAPLSMRRLKDGSVLGISRWTWPVEGGSLFGCTVRWDPEVAKYTAYGSSFKMPPEYFLKSTPFTCERHLFEEADGAVLMVGYSKTGPESPAARFASKRYAHLFRSTDAGKTWDHFSVVGPGGEPAIAKTGQGRMTAVLRSGGFRAFMQSFSEDGGKTWTPPQVLEEGSVCPDLVQMSNGLLACSYGRPASCLMFSADGGKTWTSHHVISEKTGFNYSGIVEVSPGRLLYLHDGGGLQGLYVDVERTTNP